MYCRFRADGPPRSFFGCHCVSSPLLSLSPSLSLRLTACSLLSTTSSRRQTSPFSGPPDSTLTALSLAHPDPWCYHAWTYRRSFHDSRLFQPQREPKPNEAILQTRRSLQHHGIIKFP